MKLIRCHIENFGKLHDLDVDFDGGAGKGGLVIINEKNGTGKTTLATFVKVMFFGFANEGKRNELDNERKRYMPWQGGTYGGQLTFSVGEKVYTINRTFGKKEKDDTFVLYDGATNLESNDYSGRIGEELLQIDHDSFLRTVFIGQSDCDTATTDSINAKLGNLAEVTDDINNYETVCKALSDRLTSMSATRKTGQLYKKNEEISELKNNIRKGQTLDTTIEGYIKLQDETKTRLDAVEKEQAAVQARLQKVGKIKDVAAQKELYEKLCNQRTQRKLVMEDLRQVFPGELPVEEQLDEWMEKANRLSGQRNVIQQMQLTPEELEEQKQFDEQFADGVPEPEKLASVKQTVAQLGELRVRMAKDDLTGQEKVRLEQLAEWLGDRVPEEAFIDERLALWNERIQKRDSLPARRTSVEALKQMISRMQEEQEASRGRITDRKEKKRAVLVGAIVLLLAGVVALFLQPVIGMVLLLAGVVLVAYGIVSGRNVPEENVTQDKEPMEKHRSEVAKLTEEIQRDQESIARIEEECRTLVESYGYRYDEKEVVNFYINLKESVRQYEGLLEKKRRYDKANLTGEYEEKCGYVEAFLGTYGVTCPSEQYMEEIHRLEKKVETREAFRQRMNQVETAQKAYQTQLAEIRRYLNELQVTVGESVVQQLNHVKSCYLEYKNAEKEYNNAARQVMEFQESHNMEVILNLAKEDGAESMEELNEKLNDLALQAKNLHQLLLSYGKPLDDAYEERAAVEEDELKLTQELEVFAEMKHRYHVMDKTREYMEKAKESFTSRYMQPIMSGFEKYYKMMSGEMDKPYQIDANMKLTAREHGLQRDTKMLSAGYQNMTGLCMRMALVDAMYQDEKPFIVLDDPFVHLDEEKIHGGLRFLEEVSAQYQVIYFTCHESRMGNAKNDSIM